MSQSLYTSMGGIAAAQSQLNVVSNNIANINTVGFKESQVTFQDIFSTTITAGNSPTVVTGGTNPIQIGLGVQVGTISKNFNEGTWTATGNTEDMMIQGNGFFAVQSSTDEVYLTRAGNFTVDSNGDMVNAQGYKVLGADKLFSTTSSDYTVHIPQSIVTKVVPNNIDFTTKPLADLNNCDLTMGSFNIVINTATGTDTVKVTLTNQATMQAVKDKINADLVAAGVDPDNLVCVCEDESATEPGTAGTIQFLMNGTTTSLGFNTTGIDTDTSNFILQTSLGSAVPTPVDPADPTKGKIYSSVDLDYKVNVTPVTSLTNSVSISNYTIANDGSISATYSNGDKLTIETNAADQTFQFKYTTSTGVIIRGSDVNVDDDVAVPANLQIQLANVVNPEGLVAAGGNLFQSGPNSGDMIFTVGSAMGLGKIKSGGLEASNVDLSKQFSDMIVAQRAVQANSRVFTTTSDIMQTLVSLGR